MKRFLSLLVRSVNFVLNLLVSGTGWIAAASVVIMVSLIGVDIIGRRFFNHPTGISEEVSAYLLVAVTFLGAAYTFVKGGHLSVRAVLEKLPAWGQRVMNIFSGIVGVGVCATATWYSSQLVMDSIRINSHSSTPLNTPLVIPHLLIPLGMGILGLAILAHTIKLVVDIQRSPEGLPLPAVEKK